VVLKGGIVPWTIPPVSPRRLVFCKYPQAVTGSLTGDAHLAFLFIQKAKMLPNWRITCSICVVVVAAIFVIKKYEALPEFRSATDTHSTEKQASNAPAIPSTWGGNSCATLNPFAANASCNVSARTDDSTASSSQADISAMIENTMKGDIGFFEDYLKYSRKCRDVLPTGQPLAPGCHASVLAANDAQFVALASRMAQDGVIEAQLAMGNWWLANASYLARSKSAREPQQASADQTSLSDIRLYKLSGIEPSAYLALSENPGAVNLPKFDSIESRSAAQTAFEYFAVAATTNNEASMAVFDLYKQGIRARLTPTPSS
jgi:hypothetical protein